MIDKHIKRTRREDVVITSGLFLSFPVGSPQMAVAVTNGQIQSREV
jgi:hypothetical protein